MAASSLLHLSQRAQLNGGYTIFGQVVDGMDVVNGITRRDPDQNPSFEGDAMESVTITGNSANEKVKRRK